MYRLEQNSIMKKKWWMFTLYYTCQASSFCHDIGSICGQWCRSDKVPQEGWNTSLFVVHEGTISAGPGSFCSLLDGSSTCNLMGLPVTDPRQPGIFSNSNGRLWIGYLSHLTWTQVRNLSILPVAACHLISAAGRRDARLPSWVADFTCYFVTEMESERSQFCSQDCERIKFATALRHAPPVRVPFAERHVPAWRRRAWSANGLSKEEWPQ